MIFEVLGNLKVSGGGRPDRLMQKPHSDSSFLSSIVIADEEALVASAPLASWLVGVEALGLEARAAPRGLLLQVNSS